MSKIILNASVVMKKPKHDADSLLDDLAELDSEPAMALSTFNPNKDKKKNKPNHYFLFHKCISVSSSKSIL